MPIRRISDIGTGAYSIETRVVLQIRLTMLELVDTYTLRRRRWSDRAAAIGLQALPQRLPAQAPVGVPAAGDDIDFVDQAKHRLRLILDALEDLGVTKDRPDGRSPELCSCELRPPSDYIQVSGSSLCV